MTTNEFIKELKELDKLSLRAHNSFDGGSLYIKFKTNVIAEIDNHTERSLNTYYKGFKTLDEALQKELFPLIIDYATTPIEEREERDKKQNKIKLEVELEGINLAVKKLKDYIELLEKAKSLAEDLANLDLEINIK